MSRVLKYYQAQVDDANKVTISTRTAPTPGDPLSMEGSSYRENKAKDDMVKVEEMFERAQRGAQSIVDAAQRSAARIVAEAQAQAEGVAVGIEEEARKQGYEAGRLEGEQEGNRIRQEAQAVLDEAKQRRLDIIGSAEHDIVELISKLLSKLLANTVELNPQLISMLVRSQLGSMHITGDVTIRVSPDDYDVLIGAKEEIAAAVEASVKIDIVKDVTFRKAECILETPLGSVDISLESSYRTLRENLVYL